MSCTGRVKFFLPDKGWGRLELTGPPPEGLPATEVANGVFVHLKDVAAVDENTLASLEEGQEVTFSVAQDEKGWRATEVKGADGQPLKTRLHRTMLAGIFRGVVAHWNSQRAFGWIATDLSPQSLGMQRVPKAALSLNGGRVYFRWRDCGPSQEGQEPYVQRGKAVVFQLYWDEKGLGALHVCDAITLRPLSTQSGSADHYKKLLDIQKLSGSEQLEELSKDMQKCTVCLVVSRAQAGSIIGQKGETVKALKEKSGVDRIYAENGPSDHRLVEIKGAPTAAAAAVLLIAEQLAKENQDPAAMAALPGEAPPPAGSPLEVRVAVPDEGFGRVVGKGKAQITAIEERCPGASVQIAPRVSVGSLPVQAISVGGTPEAMTEATRMVIVRVASCCGGAAAPMGGPMAPFGPASNPMGAMLMLQAISGPGGHPGMGGKGGGGKGGGGKGGKGGDSVPGGALGRGGGGGGCGPGGGGGGGRGGCGGCSGGAGKGASKSGFGKGGACGGKGKGGGRGGLGQAQPAPLPGGPGSMMPGGPGMGPGMGPMGSAPGVAAMGAAGAMLLPFAMEGAQGMPGTTPGMGMGLGMGGPVMGGPGMGPGMAPGGPGMMGPGGLPGGGLMLR